MPRVREPSKPTGLYWPCPFNPVRHPQKLALPIMRGAQRCFIRCQCTGNLFMPVDWDPREGMTHPEAGRQGYLVLTVSTKRVMPGGRT